MLLVKMEIIEIHLVSSDSSNREITEEQADDELLEEGGEDSKETQRKSKSRRKPKDKKRQAEEGKTLMESTPATATCPNSSEVMH